MPSQERLHKEILFITRAAYGEKLAIVSEGRRDNYNISRVAHREKLVKTRAASGEKLAIKEEGRKEKLVSARAK